MQKKKIFIVNDSSYIGSGYGVYGKELLTRLHNSGKYEVAELGCYATVENQEIQSIPWKFYPNAVNAQDPRLSAYKESPVNQFGAWRFNRCLLDFKPHIVFDIRDYWMYAYQEISPLKKYYHWILMPTVDSAPQKTDWLFTFANADIVVPYTEWAKKVLLESCGSNINLFPLVANAGINPNEFFPLENKSEHKIKWLGKDYNVIGLVMRNQKRKLIADMCLVFRKYLEILKENNDPRYYNTILYMHTSYPEENGWDLPAILLEYNLLDRVYFTYQCRFCNEVVGSKFKGAATQCSKCGKISNCFSSTSNSISSSKLNEIYNLFDIFVQFAICEGFGMPQIEAASCGIPIASVDYSAMSEIVEYLHGFKIPAQRMFRELETNADRAYPDLDYTIKLLVDFFNMSSDDRNNLSINTRKLCVEKYNWDKIYNVWDQCFESVDITKKIPWDNKDFHPVNHNNSVPADLNPSEFVKYICNNIIMEPDLFYSAFSQGLIRDLTNMIAARNGAIATINYNEVVEKFNSYMQNKIALENIRNNVLSPEDFITCQKR